MTIDELLNALVETLREVAEAIDNRNRANMWLGSETWAFVKHELNTAMKEILRVLLAIKIREEEPPWSSRN